MLCVVCCLLLATATAATTTTTIITTTTTTKLLLRWMVKILHDLSRLMKPLPETVDGKNPA